MKILADTSFLIPALIEKHPNHERTIPWIGKITGKEIELGICSHSLAEMYGILTTLPVSPRIQPGSALQLINENLLSKAQIIELKTADYQKALRLAAEKGLYGGVVYDILIGVAFDKFIADGLLTFNHRDFFRIFSDRKEVLIMP
jgi:predicted nucleic acid-binding protein